MRIKSVVKGLLVASLFVVAMAGVVSADIILSKGTKATIVFDEEVSSGNAKTGDMVSIRLLTPIDIGGMIVVNAGAKGTARVTEAKSNSRLGGAGFVEVEFVELESEGAYEAADGKKIQLTAEGGSIRVEGKGKGLILKIFTLGLIKGSNGVILAEKSYQAELTEDIIILMD